MKVENGKLIIDGLYSIKSIKFPILKDCDSCNAIRERLQEIDPLFEVELDGNNGQFTIYYNGAFFQATPCDEFSRETIEQIREVYRLNTEGDIVAEVDKHNEKIKLAEESKRADMIQEMAKDLRKAILTDL